MEVWKKTSALFSVLLFTALLGCEDKKEKDSVYKDVIGSQPRGGVSGHGASAKAKPTKEIGAVITGKVTVSDEIKKKLPEGGFLFVFAKPFSKQGRGFPLAVKRIPNPKFPVAFSLSQADAMVEHTRLEGKVLVTARFSPDGNVMAKAGSFEGTIGEEAGFDSASKKPIEVIINQSL